jgi:hypothetical protein
MRTIVLLIAILAAFAGPAAAQDDTYRPFVHGGAARLHHHARCESMGGKKKAMHGQTSKATRWISQ